jgi:hypothetical protein
LAIIALAAYGSTWFFQVKWSRGLRELACYRGSAWNAVYAKSTAPTIGFKIETVAAPRPPTPFAPGAVRSVTTTSLSSLAVLFVALGALPWLRLIRRRLAVPPGHCRACRYDLRASPSPVCPECGVRASPDAGP